MKIVVMATDSASTWMVVNALKESHELIVAIENPVSRLKLMRGRLKKQGIVSVLGQMLFMIYVVLLKKQSASYIRKIISESGLSSEKPSCLDISYFDSFNDVEFIGWLKEKAPDAVVVNGTRILNSRLLDSIDVVFLNTHCGITPAYRGVHGAYWALVNGDDENVGVTVHLVDSGVDTGLIVDQANIVVESYDNFTTYPIKQYIAAIPLLVKALECLSCGELQTYQRKDIPSNIWYHPTLCSYVYNIFRGGVR